MADIIPEGYAEISVPHRHARMSRAAVVTFGVAHESDWDAAGADAIQAMYDSAFGAYIDSEVTIGPVQIRAGTGAGEALTIVGTATTTGEAVATDTVPSNIALLIHKRTARGGRRGRGRMYIPWALRDEQVDELGVISSTALADLQNRANDFLAALQGGEIVPDNMVVLHSPSDPGTANPSAPGVPNVVTSLSVDPRIGTQRRRLGR